jgi:catechol 2,3-dioxygenase-like lactoylglutathione lyase family enzyme
LLFDHIAISVADLHQSLHFYQEQLGFEMLGQLLFKDARGFTITYLQAGLGVLELFSFSVPTLPRPAPATGPTIGIQRIGFIVDDIAELDSQLRVEALSEITPIGEPAGIENRAGHRLLTDVEGNLLEFSERGYA